MWRLYQRIDFKTSGSLGSIEIQFSFVDSSTASLLTRFDSLRKQLAALALGILQVVVVVAA